MIKITPPLDDETIEKLHTGDRVSISGVIYSARDAAHERMVQALERGEPLPIALEGQVIYYVGPCPARPGRPIGSAGPTTSGRMDPYVPTLLARGLKGMIGKGNRSPQVREAIKQYRAVYLAAIAGAGALMARYIVKAEVVAYQDLGAEAIRRLEVEDFPAVVINDIYGGDLYQEGKARYAKKG